MVEVARYPRLGGAISLSHFPQTTYCHYYAATRRLTPPGIIQRICGGWSGLASAAAPQFFVIALILLIDSPAGIE
jgi:hypothetical protein